MVINYIEKTNNYNAAWKFSVVEANVWRWRNKSRSW
jgi:hypothetical protein